MFSETLHDLHINHEETYVGVPMSSGEIIPAFVSSFYVDESKLYEITDGNVEPSEVESVPSEACEFELTLYKNIDDPDINPKGSVSSLYVRLDQSKLFLEYPEYLGVHEIGLGAVYGSRLAKIDSVSKYRRTPTKDGLLIVNPSAYEMKELNKQLNELLKRYLYKAYNGSSYRSLSASINLLLEGKRLACALDDKYSLHISCFSEELRLYREGKCIGEYIVDEGAVKVFHKSLLDFSDELVEIGFQVSEEILEMPSPEKPEQYETANFELSYFIETESVSLDASIEEIEAQSTAYVSTPSNDFDLDLWGTPSTTTISEDMSTE